MATEDDDLDALFALARSERSVVPADLSERIMADALREMPRPADQTQVVIRPRRGLFGFGWLQSAGLAGVTALGLAIGLLSPNLATAFSEDDYSLTDLLPDPTYDLISEFEG